MCLFSKDGKRVQKTPYTEASPLGDSWKEPVYRGLGVINTANSYYCLSKPGKSGSGSQTTVSRCFVKLDSGN